MAAKHDQLLLSQLPLSPLGLPFHIQRLHVHPAPRASSRWEMEAPTPISKDTQTQLHINSGASKQLHMPQWHRSQMAFPAHPKCRIMLYTSQGGGKVLQQPGEIESIDGFGFSPYWFTAVPKCFLEKSTRKTLAACQFIDHACCN